ncbi:MAG TPA: aspartyl protease family protein [Chthoniobacterales bacterium]|nr:aspartyl protease family protein [Chthoniobacterales bacterium]
MFTDIAFFFSRKTALLGALVVGLPTLALARTPARAEMPQYEALPMERSSQNHLLVRAEINGKPAVLLVDTGAPLSAVAIDRATHFGMDPVSAKSKIPSRLNINGAFNSMSIARSLRLGALNLVDEAMVLIDFAYLRQSVNDKEDQKRESDGILGTDILSPLKAVLDYDRMLLVLKLDQRASGPTPGFNFRGFRRVRMRESEGYNLYVDGSVNGTKARLMVDTGAFATLLHSQFVRRMQIPLRQTKFRSVGVNLAQSRVRLANITRFSIGSLDMQNNRVGVINLEGLIHGGLLEASPPVAGLLGSEMLQRYHAIIDFGTNSLYLKQ